MDIKKVHTIFFMSNSCSQNLNPSIKNFIKINQYTIKSINILAMSSRKLHEEILEQSMSNPMIDISDFFHGDFTPCTRKSNGSQFIENLPDPIPTKQNIYNQIEIYFHDKESKNLAKFLIINMDKKGFLQIDEKTICDTFGCNTKYLKQIIDIIQTKFEPRALLCIDILAYKKKIIDSIYGKLSIESKILLLLQEKHSIKKISSLLKRTINKHACLDYYMKKIKQVGPCPIEYALSDENDYVEPDVYIEIVDNCLEIIFNKSLYPNITISKEYLQISQDSYFIRKKTKEASDLLNAIQSRKKTLILIITHLCAIQKQYILNNTTLLLPLNMKQMSKTLGLHPSSITRCVQNKYINLPKYGTIPLNNLFASQFKDKQGNAICTKHIDIFIKKIVKEETSPKSDLEIKKILEDNALFCSRRTVAKRRKYLSIPNSRNR